MTEPAQNREETLTIGDVSKQLGIPPSTIRFYEKEFGSYLQVLKTAGGHRRFRTQDAEKLKYIHALVHEQGRSLRDVKAALISDKDPVLLRKDIDLLLEVFETLVQENQKLHNAIQGLTERIVALEDGTKAKKRFKIF
ncbi:MAG: MerR family transcriptional regulator [Acidobacteria bacterium]|nr:MerR family transcriptional regulator [Acidobacteriota bacterium]